MTTAKQIIEGSIRECWDLFGVAARALNRERPRHHFHEEPGRPAEMEDWLVEESMKHEDENTLF